MTAPFVRVDVWTLAEDDPIITAYSGAVAAMMSKPFSDPTSWDYQAAIHGIDPSSPLPPGFNQLLPQWNQCQHYSWYFLPWHRMFVYYFEQIVRAYVIANGGPSTWALPYWNYDGGGQSNTLPLAFRNPSNADGTTNALYTSKRAKGINAGATLPATDISLVNAFDQQTFTGKGAFGGAATPTPVQFFLKNDQAQSGALESTPHNTVHDDVGGPGGLMYSPYTAVRDPIFWLHHANIDRLWGKWLQQSQQNTNPSDGAWLTQGFVVDGSSAFVTPDGSTVSPILTCAGILDTVGQLGYQYDDEDQPSPGATALPLLAAAQVEAEPVNWPSPWPQRQPTPARPAPDAIRHLIGATDRPIRLVGEPVTVTVPIDERVTASLRADKRAAEQIHHAYLDIEGIDAERNPAQVYGVFVNLPSHFTDADLMAHHAGNISLFGIELARRPPTDRHPHTLHISMDITRLLDRIAADGTWTDGSRLEITLRPSTLGAPADREDLAAELADTAHPEVPITIGRISVYYA
jgi:tyrosinase